MKEKKYWKISALIWKVLTRIEKHYDYEIVGDDCGYFFVFFTSSVGILLIFKHSVGKATEFR
jgi:hypothetical protein